MSSRPMILILLLSTSCGAGRTTTERTVGIETNQGPENRSGPPIIIRTSHLEWRAEKEEATVSVEIRLQGTVEITAWPSLRLVAVSKTPGPVQQEYWAPFDLTTGLGTKADQRLSPADGTHPLSVRLVPSRLLWAATKSSVWPSQPLAKVVPGGNYVLRVQIEVEDGRTVSSNEVEISIAE